MTKRKTIDEFIDDAKNIHGSLYDYSLVEYKSNKDKIKIICPIHGIFEQQLKYHLMGGNCQKCSITKRNKITTKTTDCFITEAKQIHKNKFDYSLTNYVNGSTKVKIICPIHGIFEQKPSSHLMGCGCSKCFNENRPLRKTTDSYIKECIVIHSHQYSYEDTIYKGSKNKVKIMCKEHGAFFQNAGTHLCGQGCPKCNSNSSKGENKIKNFLIDENIDFEEQKRFKTCRNTLPLSFDFYLPKYNMCIEYQGQQHFNSIEIFGGVKRFENQVKNDLIKRTFCKDNNINLLTIHYKDINIIEDVLNRNLINN